MRPLEAGLLQGLEQLGLALSGAQVDRLLAYLDLLARWSQVYNLTAVRNPSDMLTHHLLDCLAVIRPLRACAQVLPGAHVGRLLDVGSGAGLPAVVIAICNPESAVDCVDAVAKKMAFVRQVQMALALPNLRAIHSRVEHLKDAYDIVSARAFASLADFTQWTQPVLAPEGVWMAMKGKLPKDEMAGLPKSIEVFHVEHLEVPGLGAERCIAWMKRAA